MGLTGKYDFPGIKKVGAKGLELLLSTTAWGAALLKIPVIGTIVDGILQLATNWLANKGLIVLNIGAIIIDGHFDQAGFDSAMDAALKAVDQHKDTLTDAQKKAIDDTVIKAFRKFAPVNPT